MGKYDVVVVGAGPAGSSAARRAAKLGASVLLLEEHAEIGVPIQCAEYIHPADEAKNIFRSSERVKGLLRVPNSDVVNRCTRLRLVSPSGQSYDVDVKGVVVDRRIFDRRLAIEAVDVGAEMSLLSKVIDVSTKGIVVFRDHGAKKRVTCDVVIGADGVPSTVARSVGLPTTKDPMDLAPTIQFQMVGIEVDPDVVEIHSNQAYTPGAYAWIIPKGEGVANVGLGVRTPFIKERVSIRHRLIRFIKEHSGTTTDLSKGNVISETGGPVPVGGPASKTFAGNVLIVGDAAGFVMACTGCGIPPAIIGGDIAGEVAANKVSGECDLGRFEETWKMEIGRELEASLEIRNMIDAAAFKGPEVIDKLLRMGRKYLDDLVRYRIPLGVRVVRKVLRI
ncbi:MAG: geranylgeranyl reductase family protein [Candidatus Bathyarchaeia archaeon]